MATMVTRTHLSVTLYVHILKWLAHLSNYYLYFQEITLGHICNFTPSVCRQVVTAYYEVPMKSVDTLCGYDCELLHVRAGTITAELH